jgi:hypothetical protein
LSVLSLLNKTLVGQAKTSLLDKFAALIQPTKSLLNLTSLGA